MKVSVRIITYNHAPFIAQAIESALMQRTNFDFEIVIGEDASNDGTREIVAEYAKKHPNKIRALFHDRKNVIYYKGKPTGRWNFIETLKACKGEYIAMLDGDDFWTNPDKLQQQVDYLDAHPDCAICAHDVTNVYPDGKEIPWTNVPSTYSFSELLTLKYYPPTSSIVYRNRVGMDFPDWFSRVMVGDFPLLLMIAEHSSIAHLPVNMAGYRHHSGGRWTGGFLADDRRKVWQAGITWDEGMVELYEIVDGVFKNRYHRLIRKKIGMLNYEMAWNAYNLHDLARVRRYVGRALKSSPTYFTPASRILRLWTVACLPGAYRAYTKAKGSLQSERTETA